MSPALMRAEGSDSSPISAAALNQITWRSRGRGAADGDSRAVEGVMSLTFSRLALRRGCDGARERLEQVQDQVLSAALPRGIMRKQLNKQKAEPSPSACHSCAAFPSISAPLCHSPFPSCRVSRPGFGGERGCPWRSG